MSDRIVQNLLTVLPKIIRANALTTRQPGLILDSVFGDWRRGRELAHLRHLVTAALVKLFLSELSISNVSSNNWPPCAE